MGNSTSAPADSESSVTSKQSVQEDRPSTLLPQQTGVYPQIVLVGDSITQQSTLTFQARLQTLYIRKADITNRGFSGYTTSLTLQSLSSFLPTHISHAPIKLVTIFLGANDACLPLNAQHIPLDDYISNLRAIINHPPFNNAQHPTAIILITPAPVNEHQLTKPLTRTAPNTKRYADAVRSLALELHLPCVDLWSVFMALAGHSAQLDSSPTAGTASDSPTPLPGSIEAPANAVLPTLLHDGIHFTPRAYEVLFDEWMRVVRERVPECLPENMPLVFRDWKDVLGVS